MADVSTVYLGTHACEMKVWFKTGRTPQAFDGTENPYMELVTTANFLTRDADDGDSNPGSRGAAEWIVGGYASGLQVANGFTTPGTWKRYVTYAYKVKLHTISGSGDTDLAFIYSHHSAAPSANAAICQARASGEGPGSPEAGRCPPAHHLCARSSPSGPRIGVSRLRLEH